MFDFISKDDFNALIGLNVSKPRTDLQIALASNIKRGFTYIYADDIPGIHFEKCMDSKYYFRDSEGNTYTTPTTGGVYKFTPTK
jgi:hypothetical protein